MSGTRFGRFETEAAVPESIDGYCLVFHMRDGRFDQIREYINPSGLAIGLLTTYVLRVLPLAAKIQARRHR